MTGKPYVVTMVGKVFVMQMRTKGIEHPEPATARFFIHQPDSMHFCI